MILPDVNVLIHAFRSDSKDHNLCRHWLDGVVNGSSRYDISAQVLSGVIRVTTHPRIFSQPSALGEVIGFCETLMDQPHLCSYPTGTAALVYLRPAVQSC
jgi:predicted nucleic acid-binding protein